MSAPAEEPASTLPGGASSLQETYQDWRLSCQSAAPRAICTVSQQQAQKNGQRVLAIELHRNGKDTLSGDLVLPFGLLLDAGATLQIDDGQPRKPLRFSTCLPGGCIVPLSFDTAMIAALRAGTALRVKAQSTDGKEFALPISLKGLAAALDRLQVLGGV
ncbi:invasion associated locus B family protein [Mesorhizobium sp. M1423]|uniref:invasion associated locus B family protein n=1 Tax=Mesorhizobium sp. M1423 TaxID=2957101 RepID=UPI00333518DB